MEKKSLYDRACEYATKVNKSYGSGFFNTHTLVDAYMAGVNEALGTQEQHRRYEIAKEVMCGMAANSRLSFPDQYNMVRNAIDAADELIKQLKGE